MTHRDSKPPDGTKERQPHVAETSRQERSQGGQPRVSGSGDPIINRPAASDHPEDAEGAAKASAENDLKTGHTTPGDGAG
jgi:hypothetical protein